MPILLKALLNLFWLVPGLTVQNAGNSGNWFGYGCPPHATGQFPYEGDCKRFYNCFKGRGQLSVCAPGTLFNPETLECDFPSKVKCLKGSVSGPLSSRITDEHYYYKQQLPQSPEYHSGLQPGGSVWTPQQQQHTHYQNWLQVNEQQNPPLRGHYIYNTKTVRIADQLPRHSGVQPPRSVPSSPSRVLLPPPLPPQAPPQGMAPPPPPQAPPLPPQGMAPPQTVPSFSAFPAIVYPQPQQVEQSLYSHSYGRNPPAPQQSFITNPQPELKYGGFDQKFDTVVPRPAITYNSYGARPNSGNSRPNSGSGFVFPDSNPPTEQPRAAPQPAQAPYYPQYPSGSLYPPKEDPLYPKQTEPSVVTAVPPEGSYDMPRPNQGRIPSYPDPPTGSGNRLDNQQDPVGNPNKKEEKDVCPQGYSGLSPHSDCTKFLSCAHGRTFVMSCGPGTRFNPELLVCDHPHKVKCYSGEPNQQDVDILYPAESQKPPGSYQIPNRSGFPDQSVESDSDQGYPATIPTTEVYITPKSEIPDYDEPYETFQKPTLSIKVAHDKETNQGSTTEEATVKNVFRPAVGTLPKGKLISKRNSTSERQILRLRGSPSQFEGFVEMQLAPGSWGIICDKHNNWKSEEAHVVCKTLGFPRGAELTWQGLPVEVSNVTSEILAADEVVCTGEEDSILDCTFNVGSGCDPGRDGVWVRCYGHGQSRCGPGELSLGENCYSLVVPDEDAPTEHLVGFTQGEALKYCQTKGGRLLDITSQLENDFVSEWLIRQNVDGNIMTSGVGSLLMGIPVWIWEGGELTFSYHNWWPGWKGVKSIPPQLTSGGAHCIVLRRHFPCFGSNATEEKLCDAQYYYWDVEDCTTMSNSQPYVCERPANNIGCVMGTGTSYKGAANITKSGNPCLNWENKQVMAEHKYKISESDRKMSLSGHNFCRNVAGKETHPWCYVKDEYDVKKELCDIPVCSKAIEKSARYFQCPPNHYSCGVNGECILSSKVCDGKYDCSNANDEVGCLQPQNLTVPAEVTILSQFVIHVNMKLVIMEIEILVETPLTECAQKCLERVNCRSFSYFTSQKQCLLSEGNIGLTGALVSAPNWNYYESKAKSINCQNSHTCKNGKCIANETICNGANDCGDNSDESDCSWLKQQIQVRLTGGSRANEGLVEVKAKDRWGLVCDDEFDLKDGDVICRHIGYPLGAQEVKKHGYFKTNQTSTFIIDNLNCTGNESSIADCHHNGWGVHDCGTEEYMNSIDYVKCSKKAAGIICKESKHECNFNYWQCATSTECIPLGFLCDNVKDCNDSSDEDPARCKSDIEVRLVGVGGVSRSNKATEGRVEVRRFGVWGTVCDDDFGEKEATVICNSLGYKGPAQAYKEAAFGAGQGIIWLDQVHCRGNETNIDHCLKAPWGQTNCHHDEDVAVVCSPQKYNTHKESIDQGLQTGIFTEESDVEEIDFNLNDIFMVECGKVMADLDAGASRYAARVVSGFETTKGAYPWQASIRVKSVSGKSNHWCGAVVVSQFHVITAGHCLRDYIKSAYFVRTGDYDSEVLEGTEQDLEIDEIWIHPDLDQGVRLNNDIAVLKVKNPGIEFNEWVLPACLPSKRELIVPKNCTISGWGSSANPGTGFARTLHATWISPLPRDQCRSPFIYGDALSDGMFCAGSLEGGPDSCQGDSGGPFLCPQRGKQMYLFGITSWGHGCGRPNSPGVYTNVPYYLDWINEKIRESMKGHRQRKHKRPTERRQYDK